MKVPEPDGETFSGAAGDSVDDALPAGWTDCLPASSAGSGAAGVPLQATTTTAIGKENSHVRHLPIGAAASGRRADPHEACGSAAQDPIQVFGAEEVAVEANEVYVLSVRPEPRHYGHVRAPH